MITLDNCEEWLYQQPERLTFIELNRLAACETIAEVEAIAWPEGGK